MEKNILIIEDEKELCFLLKNNFLKQNFQVDCELTLKEGIHKLRSAPYQFLLLDNNLPDGRGIEALPFIRSYTPRLLVIVMSALGLREAALSAGADYFMEKPISLKEINALISSVDVH